MSLVEIERLKRLVVARCTERVRSGEKLVPATPQPTKRREKWL